MMKIYILSTYYLKNFVFSHFNKRIMRILLKTYHAKHHTSFYKTQDRTMLPT